MSQASEIRDRRGLRAVDTPMDARVEGLDGEDRGMFPLLRPKDVAALIGCSVDWVHDLMANGDIPYVLIPPSRGRACDATEGRRRRIRSDHLRELAQGWTQQ